MADALRLVDDLMSRAPTLGTARLIAIDGPAGSGKTSLAHVVSALLDDQGSTVALISLDDLYDGWEGLNPALSTRIIQQVLSPLSEGRPARWQAYDWSSGVFGDWHAVAPPEVLVLEGCGAGARALAPYTTLLTWLETTPEDAQACVVARDGPQVLEQLSAWRRAEHSHYAENHTRARADVVIST